MTTKNWFNKAVYDKPPYTLGGWSKNQTSTVRRKLALFSRPKNWSLRRKILSAARALQSLSNVTTDIQTKQLAKKDANYFFKKLKGGKVK